MPPKQKEKVDPRIDKREITMRNATLLPDGNTAVMEVKDYVRPEHLAAYLADAREKWQYVSPATYEEAMEQEPNAGPGGYDGPTAVPAHLDLPDAGVVYPATGEAADDLDEEI
jgi:hypothetical protein